MTQPAVPHAIEARDQLLAGMIEEMTQDLRAGRQPRLEELAGRHPDLAEELRALWGMVQVALEFTGPRSAVPSLHDQPTLPPVPDAPKASAPLPRRFGNYELLEELGRGGMGVVYRARQIDPERIVALKMVLSGEWASAADLARFRGEAQSAARLEGHPNIVAVHEVGECNGQPYFSMRYVEGTTLARLVADGPLPQAEAARYLAIVAQAVHYAHQHGILHRDLKPNNVLVDVHGQPHVTDFGLAKRVEGGSSLTQTGAILGTPSYMSPEQASGGRQSLGPASDVYSLGAILYELLTGRPPFQSPSVFDTLMQVREQEVIRPRLLNPRIDRDLELICLKCLQKPPALRYASAADLAHDLEAFVAGEPISIPPISLAGYFLRMLGETHHAAIMENWALLWMWHSVVILVVCCITNVMRLAGIRSIWPYLGIWVVGLGTWATIFWTLRRRAGPVTFVERQIAHLWAAGTLGSKVLFLIELLLGLEVLTLSPVLALLAGGVFLGKAATLSGYFYLAAIACLLTSIFMAAVPDYGLFLFGAVSALCFFIPGWRYYRLRRLSDQPRSLSLSEKGSAPFSDRL